jgi:NAD-dependent dihydropyrimidine dehydrogenase PreA subunit/coenzyme F420-reducing hydrogenase delta subunit
MSQPVPKIIRPEPGVVSMSGPVSFLLLAILAVTGLMLFLYYPADFKEAYASLAPDGGASPVSLMRSVHRGGADLFILFVMVHAVRAFILRKYERGRWTPFVFGACLLAFALWQGVTGYILPMDLRAQSLLSALQPVSTFFFGAESVRAFSPGSDASAGAMIILLAAHLVPPFFAAGLLAGHIALLEGPRIWPGKITGGAILMGLATAALIVPATSLARADFSKTPGAVAFDWLLLFPAPAMASAPTLAFWGGSAAIVAIAGFVPYLLTRREKRDAVHVHENHCVGCGLCAKDCPYKAMSMTPRPHESKWPWLVTVEPERCVDCGVCVGACGFHALDVTRHPVETIRVEARVNSGIVAYVCGNIIEDGADGQALAPPGVTVVSVACGGQIYPGWIDDDLRGGAKGVIVAVCAPFSCSGRLGSSHASARIGHERRPFLRKRVDRGKVGFAWVKPGDNEGLAQALSSLADELRAGGVKHDGAGMTRRSLARAVLIVTLTVVSVAGLGFIWRRAPYALEYPSMSKITVTYDTHEKSSVRIFFGGALALEKSFEGSGSIEPVKVAVTARITGGAVDARVQVVEGASTHQKSTSLPPGRIVALWKNPETGALEFR